MHCYLVDQFVSDRRYEHELNRIEARLAEIGIRDRFEKLTILKNLREVVDEAVRRGSQTLVAVGDDRTVSKLVSLAARYNLTLGLIPVGPQQTIAQYLGIPAGVDACDVLSRRVIETVDLGQVGDRYFLLSLDLPAGDYQLECDGQYRVSLARSAPLSVRNFGASGGRHNPKDGILEAVIGEGPKRGFFSGWFRSSSEPSVFPVRRLTVTAAQPLPLTLDGQTVVKTPVTVEAKPRKLKVIVGRNRQF